tara:strand:+ start:5144 stop:5560 length:417 start_codon:yes stop_codon:yes gene_type:complete
MENSGFFRRIFALIYDSFAVLGIILSLTLLLVLVNGGAPITGGIADYLQLFITIFSGPLFYCYFWIVNDGQTLGMQAWKIKLISEKDLTIRICLLRCAFSTFSFLLLGMGYLYILANKERMSLADLATKTKIVRVNKS